MSTEPLQPAAAARRARAQRIHALRLRIVALGVAIFVAAWVAIFVQLETGHDPALAKDLAPVAAQTADPDTTSDWSDDATASQPAGPAQSSSSAAASDPAAVTTRQS
ncbi:MAG TPA: hypothetical protein VGO80_21410 [Solirubrobacteraceae bacterium]|nr:hypothetical protein [Solirubrobacteraceae bacterium]